MRCKTYPVFIKSQHCIEKGAQNTRKNNRLVVERINKKDLFRERNKARSMYEGNIKEARADSIVANGDCLYCTLLNSRPEGGRSEPYFATTFLVMLVWFSFLYIFIYTRDLKSNLTGALQWASIVVDMQYNTFLVWKIFRRQYTLPISCLFSSLYTMKRNHLSLWSLYCTLK